MQKFSEMTSQQLSIKHFHHKPNTFGRQIPGVQAEMVSDQFNQHDQAFMLIIQRSKGLMAYKLNSFLIIHFNTPPKLFAFWKVKL